MNRDPGPGKRLLWLAPLLALLLTAPPAAAEPPEPPLFVGLVVVESAEPGVWTLTETLILAPGNGTPVEAGPDIALWAPPGATVNMVTVDGAPALWFHDNTTAIRVPLDAPLRQAVATFTLRGAPGYPVALPYAGRENAVEVRALPGHVPAADGLAFADTGTEVAGRHVWEARPGAVAPFSEWRLTVAAPAAPEAPAWPFALAAVAALILLAGIYWARRRGLAARAEAPMTIVGHLRELSTRLVTILVAVGFFLVLFFSFGVARGAYGGYTVWYPFFTVNESVGTQAFRYVAESFIPPGVTLVVTGPADALLAQLQMTLLLAILTAIPVIVYEVGAFLAPAMLENERRFVLKVVPAVAGLFLLGAGFAFFIMIPFMLRTLYGFAYTLGATPLITTDGLIGFTVWTTLLFGLAFELPVAMTALSALGIVHPRTYLTKWRHAIITILILSGIVTPDPTVVSQLLVALPLFGLYFAGAIAARHVVRARERRVAAG